MSTKISVSYSCEKINCEDMTQQDYYELDHCNIKTIDNYFSSLESFCEEFFENIDFFKHLDDINFSKDGECIIVMHLLTQCYFDLLSKDAIKEVIKVDGKVVDFDEEVAEEVMFKEFKYKIKVKFSNINE